MQLSQIEYFIAVAESTSFTQGARRVNIVQSAVSAAIRQLEHELGSDLFIRQGRSIRLTPAGEAMLPRARTILADVQAARDAVDAVRGTVRGTVALGTLAHAGSVDVMQILRTVRRDYPGIVIKLRQTVQGTRTSLADVRSGALDLALVSVPEEAAPGLELHPLHAEGIVFACSDSHPLADRKRVSLSEIADEPFVDFPEGWGNRTTVDAAFAAAGLHRTVHTEVVSFTMATELVREGLGVAFLPESALQHGQEAGIRAIHTPLVWRIQLARSANRQTTAAEQVLIDQFRGGGDSIPA
ncbi:LysR family transcriptional regulator [Arthrobacter sp. MA-N2]|uniref:LysR family transcriptional regulator n=1 Tax=Arthrobacter sp. MA-N2 TaxID=1101188 RepID=UPI000480756F|nr:LysR family transcriptional regulator [Arthrobacter sp. MA-N2]